MMRFVLLFACILMAGACGYDAGAIPDARAGGDAPPGSDGGSSGDSGLPGGSPGDGGVSGAPPGDGGSLVSACSNGIDDDCDGLTDHAGADPGCVSPNDDDEHGPGLICDDGLDNDGDQVSDFKLAGCAGGDPGCTSPNDTTELSIPRSL